MMVRTRFVRVRALVLVAAMAASLAACASDAKENGGSGEADANGVLKYGYPMPIAGLHLDPVDSVVAPDALWMAQVYGTLLRLTADGSIEPWMAESAEVVDSKTVRIKLRPDVKFTDGSAYDAEAVQTSLMRSHTPSPTAAAGQDPGMKALESVEIIDPLTVEAHLSAPIAGQFMSEMAQRGGAIQSPKQIAENPDEIDTNPIGAGPFVLENFTPNQLLSFRRNPDYWDAGNVKLGGIDFVNTPTGPQQVNGLLSGNLDWAPFVAVDSAESVEADKKYETHVSDIYTVELLMCTGKPPFNNEAVRKAVQLAVDREAYNKLAFGGLSEPAVSLFRENNKNFNPDVKEFVKYDPEEAQDLLSSVGDVTVDLHYPATLDFGTEAEALQAQLQKVGFKVNITAERDSIATFITPQKPGALLSASIGSVGYGVLAGRFGKGRVLALCGVDRPDVMAAADRAMALSPDDPEAIAAFQEAQELIAEHAYQIPLVSFPQVNGLNVSRIGGKPEFSAFGHPRFDTLYIKK